MDAHLFSLPTAPSSSLVKFLGSGVVTSAPPLAPFEGRGTGTTGRGAVCGCNLPLPAQQALPPLDWERESILEE